MLTIRTANPDTDYARVVEIINTHEPENLTVERLKELDERDFDNQIRRRMVAVDEDGTIKAYGVAMHTPWMARGRFFVLVIVDPAYRRQGIGSQMYDACLAYAGDNGMTALETWVFDNQAESLQFAEERGFTIEAHIFESTIDLYTFDESPFAGLVEAVQTDGIRLVSLAEVGNTLENLRKLWEVNYQTYLDDPGSTGTFPSFEQFQVITSESWFRPEGQFLALDGERYIGLAAVGYFKDSNSAYNMMTGILPAYRGRKIPQALKLLTIRMAKSWGADYIRTNNDSRNVPMLAINRKLGYVPEPGGYRMVKAVVPQVAPEIEDDEYGL